MDVNNKKIINAPVNEDVAKSILAVNNLHQEKPKKHSALFYFIFLLVFVLIIILALFSKTNTNPNSSSNNPNITIPDSNNPLNTSNSINQQIKYCSNIVNGGTVC